MFSQLFVKSEGIYPMALSPKSYSGSQLLLCHSFILPGASFIPAVNSASADAVGFFLTKIGDWILHSLPKCYSWITCGAQLMCHLWSLSSGGALLQCCEVLVELEGGLLEKASSLL